MNATTTPASNKTTSQPNTTAAQACCQGASDAYKAGVDANQKMFGTFADMFSKGFNPFNMNAFAAPMNTIPAAFEKMSKVMNGVVDANARFATECNALVIDTVRTNARTIERTGEMMVGQLTGATNGKTVKPVTETAREIFDEACGFTTKTGERVMKMNTEHAQSVAKVMDEVFVKTACCNG